GRVLEAFAVLDLLAVGVAHHVVGEHDAAQTGQADAWGLQRIAGAFERLFATGRDILLGGRLAGVIHPAVVPVAVREQDRGQFAGLALGPIEVAAHIMAGITGEEDLFDGVVAAVDLAVDDRAERSPLGQRPQAVGDQDLLAQLALALLPLGARGRRL